MNKKIKILFCGFIMLFNLNTVHATSIPTNAKKRSIIQYKNNKLNVLVGEIITDETLDYDMKENDIITYADDTNILQIYSKYDNKKSISGYLFNFLYDEFDFKLNIHDLYLFKSISEDEIIFENTTTDGLLIYESKIKQHEKENEITTRYTYLDKKFNKMYDIYQNGANKKIIKTNGDINTLIKLENSEGVAYEPKK